MTREARAQGAHEAFLEVVADLRKRGLNALADHYTERAKGMRYAAMRPNPASPVEDRGDSPTIPIYAPTLAESENDNSKAVGDFTRVLKDQGMIDQDGRVKR